MERLCIAATLPVGDIEVVIRCHRDVGWFAESLRVVVTLSWFKLLPQHKRWSPVTSRLEFEHLQSNSCTTLTVCPRVLQA